MPGTTRTTSSTAQHLNLNLPVGRSVITADPAATGIRLTVRANSESGPYAAAVEGTTLREEDGTLWVEVPQVRTEVRPVRIGGMTFNALRGTVIHNTVATMVISGEGISVVGDGNVIIGNVVQTGTGDQLGDDLVVEVAMPAGGSVVAVMGTADLQVHGDLRALTSTTETGSVRVDSVHNVHARVDTGSIRLGRVGGSMSALTGTGSVHVDSYEGSSGQAVTDTGSVHVTATPAATGALRLRTSVGSIKTVGTRHLRVEASATIGRISHR